MSRNLILFEQRSKCQDLSPATLKKGIRESVSSQQSSAVRGRGGAQLRVTATEGRRQPALRTKRSNFTSPSSAVGEEEEFLKRKRGKTSSEKAN